MKLKRLPEDFQVEEIGALELGQQGAFACYRLTKRAMGTPEAVQAIARRWNISPPLISYGGLKDRHALTMQFITIRRGPRRNLRQKSIQLEYLGQTPRAFTPRDIQANRFRIVLRQLNRAQLARAGAGIDQALIDGVPNYFDDQRFGSLTASGEFVAQPWIHGDYERTLWLALVEPNPRDRSRERIDKQWLRNHWGDWQACLDRLPKSSDLRRVFDHLCLRPTDFRGAFARIRAELRGLYLAAFQSYLWNRLLATLLDQTCRPDQLVQVDLKTGPVPFTMALDDRGREKLQSTLLPLPSSRIHLSPGPAHEIVEHSLGQLGLSLRALRVKYPRDSFFSKGWRPAIFHVSDLAHETAHDELYQGYQKLSLRCTLPRGSYGTILVKRITQAAENHSTTKHTKDTKKEQHFNQVQ